MSAEQIASTANINSITAMKNQTSGSIINTLFLFALIIGFMVWTNYQQKKKDKGKQEMLNNLKEGDMVQTYGGIIGIIGFISEDKKIIELKTGINFSSKVSINIQAIDQKLDHNG
jgi:preprotein translocase YajC subunit